MAVKGGTSEWCTTIRRHLTTSSLVLVKSKVQSTLGGLSTSHREYRLKREQGGQMLRWGGEALQTECS